MILTVISVGVMMILREEEARAAFREGRWPHFSIEEFESHGSDGAKLIIEADFMDRLERVRVKMGRSLAVTSGYRTPIYNEKVSNTGPHGPHTTGRACDIAITGGDALRLVGIAIEEGFTGIGVKQKGSTRFIHLDDLPGGMFQPRPWIWSY